MSRSGRPPSPLPPARVRELLEAAQRSRVLGVVLPTLLNPTFAECLQGIAQAAVALVDARYLLPEDVPEILRHAAAHYAWATRAR